MPEITVRATAIADALLNRTATPTERQRLLAAFSADLDKPATNAQAAKAMVGIIQNFVVEFVRAYESRAASASVKADFTESP